MSEHPDIDRPEPNEIPVPQEPERRFPDEVDPVDPDVPKDKIVQTPGHSTE